MNNIKDAENILTTILQMSKEEQALVMGFIEGIKYDFTEISKGADLVSDKNLKEVKKWKDI